MSMQPEQIAQVATFLEHTELFRGVDRASLEKIARATAVQEYGKGDNIIRQGTESSALFIIAKGAATILVEDRDVGVVQEVAKVQAPETVGEMGLLLSEPRTATVRADGEATCIILSREAFHRICQNLPQVPVTVSRNLARRLQEQNKNMGFQFVRLRDFPFDPELYSAAPPQLLERHQVVPLRMDGETLIVAMTRPNDPAANEAVRAAIKGVRLRPVACAADDYDNYLRDVVRPALGLGPSGARASGGAQVNNFRASDLIFLEEEARKKTGTDVPGDATIRMFNEVLTDAINRGSSDIHIEAGANAMQVRYRVDGRMTTAKGDVNLRFHAPLVSRIKITGGMDISERRRPQDGRASFRYGDRSFDIRISTLPSKNGEKVVMRILDPQTGVVPIDKLILSESLASIVRKAVFRPSGSILIVGPTGSGKTTTLYSTLNERKETSNDLNICTVEDPIEYSLDGVTQVQVNHAAGMGFPEVLRALLRQDPDVMMIGEMRDAVTAQIGLEGALTGHVVLSTLHAEGAVEATTRLTDMGCPSYLVSTAVDLVVAQRLLRRVCEHCRTEHTYSEIVRRNLARANIVSVEDQSVFYKGAGCSRCHNTGYSGRVGAYEVLQVNDAVSDAIALGESEQGIRKVAVENRTMTTFKQYGSFLLRSGLTTPSEVLRFFGGE